MPVIRKNVPARNAPILSQNDGFRTSSIIVSRSLNTPAISVTDDTKPEMPDNGFRLDDVDVSAGVTVIVDDWPASERIESA